MAGRRRWPPNNRLVYERERRAWSQEEAASQADQLAIRLGLRGVVFSGAQFGRWERGECRPRPPYLGVVCRLYEASAETLGLCDPPRSDGFARVPAPVVLAHRWGHLSPGCWRHLLRGGAGWPGNHPGGPPTSASRCVPGST